MNASRHQDIKAFTSRATGVAPSHRLRRAFSLIEVLLAIFILGIGVISIAALFPAGIAQQRLSVDEMMGPIVADSAITVIRGKVHQDDFGTFEEFTPPGYPMPPLKAPRPTVPGDWSWLRPAVLFGNDPTTLTTPPAPAVPVDYDDRGSIDIFSAYAFYNSPQPPANLRATEFPNQYVGGSGLFGIPFNRVKYDNPATPVFDPAPPVIVITQEERYYPMTPRKYTASDEAVKPQYVWDCMFRRFQGRILVAIFVYRVNVPGGGTASNYFVPQNGNVPSLPVWLDLVTDPATNMSPPDYCAGGAWDSYSQAGVNPPNDAVVLGTKASMLYDPGDARQAWQEPRQWIIDQNNNSHRVLGQTRTDYDTNAGDVQVELARPVTPPIGAGDMLGVVPPYPYSGSHFFYLGTPWNLQPGMANRPPFVSENIVTDIWYIPLRVEYDLDNDGTPDGEWTLTPVYATVKEL